MPARYCARCSTIKRMRSALDADASRRHCKSAIYRSHRGYLHGWIQRMNCSSCSPFQLGVAASAPQTLGPNIVCKVRQIYTRHKPIVILSSMVKYKIKLNLLSHKDPWWPLTLNLHLYWLSSLPSSWFKMSENLFFSGSLAQIVRSVICKAPAYQQWSYFPMSSLWSFFPPTVAFRQAQQVSLAQDEKKKNHHIRNPTLKCEAGVSFLIWQCQLSVALNSIGCSGWFSKDYQAEKVDGNVRQRHTEPHKCLDDISIRQTTKPSAHVVWNHYISKHSCQCINHSP